MSETTWDVRPIVPEIECVCGFVSRLDTAKANLEALELHNPVCPSTFDQHEEPARWHESVFSFWGLLFFVAAMWAVVEIWT